MTDQGRYNVLGAGIDAVDYAAAIERILAAARRKAPLGASALAVHGVMTGASDPVHRARLNDLELVVPDGQPVRWALRLLYGVRLADRVYGPRLTLELCRRMAEEALPAFFYGSTPAVLERLQTNLLRQFPALRIAGAMPSRFRRLTPAERDEVVQTIRGSGAAVTFVGLGCPRQEVWAYEFRGPLSMPVLAVGAAFDFHAGRLAQAPAWMQRRGLEWAFRLAAEPRRLWRRYLLLNPAYLTLLALQRLRLVQLRPGPMPQPYREVLFG